MTDNGTNPAAYSAAPVSQGARIDALDLVRGCAVLGILLMNIWAFAGPQAFFDNPAGIADWPGSPVATWAVVHSLFEGSQRALFSLLFGAGMLLMVTRLGEVPGVPLARVYYRRIFLLICIGLFDAFILLWPADILFTYGLCGLLLYPLRRLPVPALVIMACLVIALNAGLRVADLNKARELQAAYPEAALRADEDAAAAKIVADWKKIESRTRPDVNGEEITETIRITSSGSFAEFYKHRATSSLVLQTVVALNAWFLDALAVMLLGMAALRAGLFTTKMRRPAVLLLVVGYAVGLPLALAETVTLLNSNFDPVLKKQWLVTYDLRRLAVAAGHLGLLLLWSRSVNGQWLKQKLGNVGRMALSNYLAHSVICGLIFYTVGLGLFGRYTGWHLYVFVALIWLLQISFSSWWLARYRFGPAEWCWRSLTYRRRQAMRRTAET